MTPDYELAFEVKVEAEPDGSYRVVAVVHGLRPGEVQAVRKPSLDHCRRQVDATAARQRLVGWPPPERFGA